jgi:4-carboxymuconolactone decarboxylase
MVNILVEPDVVDPVERRARGMDVYEIVTGKPATPPASRREETLLDFVFAEVWTRGYHGVLGFRERRLLVLTTLAATYSHDDLERHLYGAAKSGDFTIEELDEWVMQLAVYSGWAVAETADRVLQEQWELVHAERGVPAPARPSYEPTTELEDQEERKQFGEWYYRVINWIDSPPRTVPYYKDGILSFVFAKMWPHKGLSARDRRIVTLACVAVDDTQLPVQAHVFGALRSGDLTVDECRECVLQFGVYGGWPKASYFQMVVEEQSQRIALMDYLPPAAS